MCRWLWKALRPLATAGSSWMCSVNWRSAMKRSGTSPLRHFFLSLNVSDIPSTLQVEVCDANIITRYLASQALLVVVGSVNDFPWTLPVKCVDSNRSTVRLQGIPSWYWRLTISLSVSQPAWIRLGKMLPTRIALILEMSVADRFGKAGWLRRNCVLNSCDPLAYCSAFDTVPVATSPRCISALRCTWSQELCLICKLKFKCRYRATNHESDSRYGTTSYVKFGYFDFIYLLLWKLKERNKFSIGCFGLFVFLSPNFHLLLQSTLQNQRKDATAARIRGRYFIWDQGRADTAARIRGSCFSCWTSKSISSYEE